MVSCFPEIGNIADPFNRDGGRTKPLMISDCIRVASEVFDVPIEDIKSHRRDREIARARQAAMWAARIFTEKSQPQIGHVFDRDHTTVIHACRQIELLRKIRHGSYRQLTNAMTRHLEDMRKNITSRTEAW